MSEIKRRDFLKILGLSGASTGLVGCAQEPAQKLIPYLVRPEEIIPGIPTYYASTCRECPAGCGLHVKVREGRPIKIEGNPDHPSNAGWDIRIECFHESERSSCKSSMLMSDRSISVHERRSAVTRGARNLVVGVLSQAQRVSSAHPPPPADAPIENQSNRPVPRRHRSRRPRRRPARKPLLFPDLLSARSCGHSTPTRTTVVCHI